MSDKKRPKPEEPPKRGDAAWRAERDAVASRNDQARKVARERRQRRDEDVATEKRVADRLEHAELARRHSESRLAR